MTLTVSAALLNPAVLPAQNVSVSPASGSGLSQVFTATYADANGYQDISLALLLVNSGFAAGSSCYVSWLPANNGLYLMNDAGISWLGPISPGSAATVQNSQCVLNAATSSVSVLGNNRVVSYGIGFLRHFGDTAPQKSLYAFFYDAAGYSAFDPKGTWTVASVSQPPANTSVSPSAGSGPAQSFTFTASSNNGYSYIDYMYILIDGPPWAYQSCYLLYTQSSHSVILLNDNASLWSGPLTLGGAGGLENSQCRIDGIGSSDGGSANSLAVTVAVTFKPAYIGPQNMFMDAVDGAGLNSGTQQMGAWTGYAAQFSSPPQPVSVTPAAGAGMNQTFSFVSSDQNGAGYSVEQYILINATNTVANACYVAFIPLWNGLSLMNDAGTAWLNPITMGQAGTVANSQCTIDGLGSSATLVGLNLTVNLAVTFQPGFAGAKDTYMEVDDHGGQVSLGPRAQLGTWTVGTPPPATVSVAPNSGTGMSQNFTATYGDANGYQDIGSAFLLVNSAPTAPASCYAQVLANSGFYLMNDGGNSWLGPILPGSNAVLQNSQCVLSAAISSASGTGNTLTVQYGITFLSAFAGSKNLYPKASGAAGDSPPLQPPGTWTVAPPVVPDFTISLIPVTAAVMAGGTLATYTVAIGAVNGFAGTVSFVPSGLPGGAYASFSPPSINGSGTATMTVNTALGGVTGTFSGVIVTGISGALNHPSPPVSLLVQDFTIALSPDPQTVPQNTPVTYTVSAYGVNGFNQPINLTYTNPNVPIIVGPSPLSPGNSAALQLGAPWVVPGSFTTVGACGTFGGVSHCVSSRIFISNSGDFSITPSASSRMQTVAPPGTANYPITVNGMNNFTGTVNNFSVAGLPSGVSAYFTPQSVAAGGLTMLAVSAATGVLPGNYPLTVTGANASAGTRSTTVWLVIPLGPAVTVTPPVPALSPSQSTQFSAIVNGTTNTAVTWAVNGPGVITSTGLYTAMAAVSSSPTATITATTLDGAQGTATVSLTVPTGSIPTGWLDRRPVALDSGQVYAYDATYWTGSGTGSITQQIQNAKVWAPGVNPGTASPTWGPSSGPVTAGSTPSSVTFPAFNLASLGFGDYTFYVEIYNWVGGQLYGGLGQDTKTYPQPSISSLSTTYVPVGSSAAPITINGTGLGAADLGFNFYKGITSVNVTGPDGSGGGVIATFVPTPFNFTVTGNTVQATLDTTNAMPGTYNVSVTVFGYTTNALSLTLADPTPQITSISPSHIDAGSGLVPVTISGSGFGANPALDLSGVQISPAGSGLTLNGIGSWSPNQITVTMSTDASASGNYGVSVVSRGATGLGFAPAPASATSDTSDPADEEVSSVQPTELIIANNKSGQTGDCYWPSGDQTHVGYLRVITYRVVGPGPKHEQFYGSAVPTVTESVQTTSAGSQLASHGSWQRTVSPYTIRADGTFDDFLGAGGNRATGGGPITANQSFTAAGGSGNLIVNIGNNQFNVLSNSYGDTVTVAQTTSPRACTSIDPR